MYVQVFLPLFWICNYSKILKFCRSRCAFRIQSNIYEGAFVQKQLKAVDYFGKKAQSQMFNYFLNVLYRGLRNMFWALVRDAKKVQPSLSCSRNNFCGQVCSLRRRLIDFLCCWSKKSNLCCSIAENRRWKSLF